MAVTFFGHRDTPDSVEAELRALTELLVQKGETEFFAGNQGNFDYLVKKVLTELKKQYPHIRCTTVLAYLPKAGQSAGEYADTVFPEGMETVPPRFAISKRNRWMLAQADTVVVYVQRTDGGAAKWEALAIKQGKKVIRLGDRI